MAAPGSGNGAAAPGTDSTCAGGDSGASSSGDTISESESLLTHVNQNAGIPTTRTNAPTISGTSILLSSEMGSL